MIIGATFTGNAIPPYKFPRPVAVYHHAALVNTTDSTDVPLADVIAPVGNDIYFIVRNLTLTAYANGDGASPVLQLQTDKGAGAGVVTFASAGSSAGVLTTVQGVLRAGERLLLHPIAGTGTTETGSSRVTATLIDPGPQ